MNKETILQALHWRYAVKIFDTTKKVSDDDIMTIVNAGRLSPSAYGVEPWHFIIVNNKSIREELRKVSYNQPKVTDASHLIVIAHRTDGYAVVDELIERTALAQGKKPEELQGLRDTTTNAVTALGEEKTKAWYKNQSYIPLGMMIETAALLQIDSGPMEGFDADKVDEILGLKDNNLHATTMLALGYRGDDPYAQLRKTRKSFDQVVTTIE